MDLSASGAEASLHGDLKSFFTASFPYESALLPDDPFGQGVADLRLKGTAGLGPLSLELHHTATALTGGGASFTSTGVGFQAPELVDLSWVAFQDDLTLRGRVDRLVLRAETTGLEVAVGRQAISFGSGLFFTPLDLVNPFTPAVIDQEYKPGVDAARIDVYPSVSSRLTVVGAYTGSGWDAGETVLTAWGQQTVGTTDLGLLLGRVHGDLVAGGSVNGGIGPVGVHADAAITVPTEETPEPIFGGTGTPLGQGDPYVRAVAGALFKPLADTTVSLECYVQSFSTAEPFADALHPRYLRGELWLYGPVYGGLAVQQQVTPLVSASLSGVFGVDSALLTGGIGWSASDNTEVAAGGFFGLGARPDPVSADLTAVRSEFGTYPASAYVQLKTYF